MVAATANSVSAIRTFAMPGQRASR
jgi:hypothetical protein